jgi:hypothetical protein
MSDWLYDFIFFRDVFSPLLLEKDGKYLSSPQIFIVPQPSKNLPSSMSADLALSRPGPSVSQPSKCALIWQLLGGALELKIQ